MTHYFRKGSLGEKVLIPFVYRGVTLQFISYTSLFSGSKVDEGTSLLLEYLKIPPRGSVLDVGCGYGVIGISVAKVSPNIRVFMVDINPLAVKVAKMNARLNRVDERVTVVEGDSYNPFKGLKFNAIYSNPPLSAGMSVVEKIVLNAANYLEPGGWAQFVLARGGESILEKAGKVYGRVEKISKKGYTVIYLEP
ncbi:MAG: methyltransferase [Thermogladius sp.]|nr:methyltransferase [Thermogladius sp.]